MGTFDANMYLGTINFSGASKQGVPSSNILDFGEGGVREMGGLPVIEIHFLSDVSVVTTGGDAPLGFDFMVVTADNAALTTDPIMIGASMSFDHVFGPVIPLLGQRFQIGLGRHLEDQATLMKRYLGVIYRSFTAVDGAEPILTNYYTTSPSAGVEFHFAMESAAGPRYYPAGATT